MTTTHSLIASRTLNTSAASVTFTNIPQTFTDLLIKVSGRSTTNTTGIDILFNGSSTSYSNKRLYGTGSSALSDSAATTYISNTMINDSTYTTSIFGNGEIYIPNYTSSNNKSVSANGVSENNSTTALMMLTAGLWSNTAAITTILLRPNTGSFSADSCFFLYGIDSSSAQNKSVPYASGGDTVTTDGTYWYHTFTKSDNFIPWKNLTADILVVAGGGGGSHYRAGGGGGGFSEQTGRSCIANTPNLVVVGAGGPGLPETNNILISFLNYAGSGGNSRFDTIISDGGGGGGWKTGVNGGSGGGGGLANGTGGSSTQGNTGGATGYGNAGGNGMTDSVTYTNAGGGGGAGAAGSNATSSGGGNGGNGKSSSISGSSVTYAGGGGGGTDNNSKTRGTGGTGGGGDGGLGNSTPGSSGTVNTGGGGGGNMEGVPGYNGGSGIVIVRYAV